MANGDHAELMKRLAQLERRLAIVEQRQQKELPRLFRWLSDFLGRDDTPATESRPRPGAVSAPGPRSAPAGGKRVGRVAWM